MSRLELEREKPKSHTIPEQYADHDSKGSNNTMLFRVIIIIAPEGLRLTVPHDDTTGCAMEAASTGARARQDQVRLRPEKGQNRPRICEIGPRIREIGPRIRARKVARAGNGTDASAGRVD
eukprot:1647016-Rhodomonas_salina.1